MKTALSTRLTSSVRDISAYSVETAAVVSAFAHALTERLDGRLHITRTLGAATAYSPDLAAVLREAPEAYAGPGERVVPVAALAGTALARSADWQAEFARLALSVCLTVLDLGVALEAHGQNLLVVLASDGAPLRLVYRDLADIRISPARLARHGLAVPPWRGGSSRTTRPYCGASSSVPWRPGPSPRRRARRRRSAKPWPRPWTARRRRPTPGRCGAGRCR